MMSGEPVWPNPLIPHSAQVAGMNCIGPSAPALDGPSLAPLPLSISPIAASTVQDMPGQYIVADALYRGSGSWPARRWSARCVATGSLLTVTTA